MAQTPDPKIQDRFLLAVFPIITLSLFIGGIIGLWAINALMSLL